LSVLYVLTHILKLRGGLVNMLAVNVTTCLTWTLGNCILTMLFSSEQAKKYKLFCFSLRRHVQAWHCVKRRASAYYGRYMSNETSDVTIRLIMCLSQSYGTRTVVMVDDYRRGYGLPRHATPSLKRCYVLFLRSQRLKYLSTVPIMWVELY